MVDTQKQRLLIDGNNDGRFIERKMVARNMDQQIEKDGRQVEVNMDKQKQIW